MAANDDVQVKFGADTTGIKKGSDETAAILRGLKGQVSGISDEFKKLGVQLVAAFSIAGITQFIQSMADLGDQIQDTAMQLGVTTERVSELAYIANASGDSLESVAKGMERLGYTATRAAAGDQTASDAFARLGVSVRDAAGNIKSMDQLLMETADSFATHADGAEKVALAIQLFGRAGVNMIPILNGGRQEFERLQEVARRTGTVLSGETVAKMVAVQQAAIELKVAFQGLGVAIFNVFQPAILGVTRSFTHLIETITGSINESYEMGGAWRFVALMAATVTSAIMTIIAAFELLWDVASAVLDSIGTTLGNVATAVGQALQGDFAAATSTLSENVATLGKQWTDTGGKITGVLGSYKDNIKEMWAAILNPPAFQVPATGGTGPGGGLSPFAPPTNFQAQQQQLQQLKQTLSEVQSELQSAFQGVFQNIMSGFDRAISGLISGTMDWKQALLTVADSIWSTFVKLIEDWVVKWLAGEATMLVAHQNANAAKVASDMATENASSGKMIMGAVKAIFVSSKQTAAGVTANLAPSLGPAAIPAGLAAGAAVAGMASLDVGAWNLDRDQVAKVHKGEMIVPARGGMADQMRDMLSGLGSGGGGKGGNTFDFSGATILDKRGLVKLITDTFNNNPSMRPSY